MKLNSLSPIKGSVSKRKRVGRGHGSGLVKHLEEVIRVLDNVQEIKKEHGLKVVKCLLLVDCLEEDLQIFLKKNFKLLM